MSARAPQARSRNFDRSGNQVGSESHSDDTAPRKGTARPRLRQVAFRAGAIIYTDEKGRFVRGPSCLKVAVGPTTPLLQIGSLNASYQRGRTSRCSKVTSRAME